METKPRKVFIELEIYSNGRATQSNIEATLKDVIVGVLNSIQEKVNRSYTGISYKQNIWTDPD